MPVASSAAVASERSSAGGKPLRVTRGMVSWVETQHQRRSVSGRGQEGRKRMTRPFFRQARWALKARTNIAMMGTSGSAAPDHSHLFPAPFGILASPSSLSLFFQTYLLHPAPGIEILAISNKAPLHVQHRFRQTRNRRFLYWIPSYCYTGKSSHRCLS